MRRNPDENLLRLKRAAEAGGPEDRARYLRAKLRTISGDYSALIHVDMSLEVNFYVEDPSEEITEEDVAASLADLFEMWGEERTGRGLNRGEIEVIHAIIEDLLGDWEVVDYEED